MLCFSNGKKQKYQAQVNTNHSSASLANQANPAATDGLLSVLKYLIVCAAFVLSIPPVALWHNKHTLLPNMTDYSSSRGLTLTASLLEPTKMMIIVRTDRQPRHITKLPFFQLSNRKKKKKKKFRFPLPNCQADKDPKQPTRPTVSLSDTRHRRHARLSTPN